MAMRKEFQNPKIKGQERLYFANFFKKKILFLCNTIVGFFKEFLKIVYACVSEYRCSAWGGGLEMTATGSREPPTWVQGSELQFSVAVHVLNHRATSPWPGNAAYAKL